MRRGLCLFWAEAAAFLKGEQSDGRDHERFWRTNIKRGDKRSREGLQQEQVQKSMLRSSAFTSKEKQKPCTVLNRGAAHFGELTLRAENSLECENTEGRGANQALFRKARCEGMWEQENSSGYGEEDRDCRMLRILRRKTSQDDVTGHGRRKEKESS